jgi:predicted nucleic acid-binding protein
VSRAPLVFLDANILFSAALGGEPFELLLALAAEGRIRLATSRACVAEAETNLERKRPEAAGALAEVLAAVRVEPDHAGEYAEWAAALVHSDDVHVLAGARAAAADVLLTGDRTHFGALMERDDLGLRVRTLRDFLLEGPR